MHQTYGKMTGIRSTEKVAFNTNIIHNEEWSSDPKNILEIHFHKLK